MSGCGYLETDVDEDDCASLKDPEVTLGPPTFSSRRSAKRRFKGDEGNQKSALRPLGDTSIEEESDFYSDEDVVFVTPPSVAVASKWSDEPRRQRRM